MIIWGAFVVRVSFDLVLNVRVLVLSFMVISFAIMVLSSFAKNRLIPPAIIRTNINETTKFLKNVFFFFIKFLSS